MTVYRIGNDGQLIDARTPRRDDRQRHRDPDRAWRHTPEWRRLSKQVVEEEGECAYCGTAGSEANPLGADHVLSAKARPDLRFERSNLRCACRTCNSTKGG